MPQLNALVVGVAGAVLSPLFGLALQWVTADGAWRRLTDPSVLSIFVLVLAMLGFSVGVIVAVSWNLAIKER